MKPLLFIIVVVGVSMLVSLQVMQEDTWFTYYAGGMAGLLVSGAALEFWNKRKRKQEEEEAKAKGRRRW
jgi:predicted tellurium resistance membrane protein TerC